VAGQRASLQKTRTAETRIRIAFMNRFFALGTVAIARMARTRLGTGGERGRHTSDARRVTAPADASSGRRQQTQ
jgi:hypothetical protein